MMLYIKHRAANGNVQGAEAKAWFCQEHELLQFGCHCRIAVTELPNRQDMGRRQ